MDEMCFGFSKVKRKLKATKRTEELRTEREVGQDLVEEERVALQDLGEEVVQEEAEKRRVRG